jgi:hypothetical protein
MVYITLTLNLHKLHAIRLRTQSGTGAIQIVWSIHGSLPLHARRLLLRDSVSHGPPRAPSQFTPPTCAYIVIYYMGLGKRGGCKLPTQRCRLCEVMRCDLETTWPVGCARDRIIKLNIICTCDYARRPIRLSVLVIYISEWSSFVIWAIHSNL